MESKIRTIDLNDYKEGEESPFGIAPIDTGFQKDIRPSGPPIISLDEYDITSPAE